MRPRALGLILAAAIGSIGLSLPSAAAADGGGSSGAPGSLTHHFPLGTQTLSGSVPTPAPTHSSSAPRRPGTTAATRHRQAEPTSRTPDKTRILDLILIADVAAVLVVALTDRVVVRRSRRREENTDGDEAPAEDALPLANPPQRTHHRTEPSRKPNPL